MKQTIWEQAEYRCTVTSDRYGGTYNGGFAWIAADRGGDDTIPVEALFGDAFRGDIEAGEFWVSPAAEKIGRGHDPNEAVLDFHLRAGKPL